MSEIDQIAAALAKAQGEMTHATLDGVNPHFKSKFATLQSVISSVRGPLSSNGIAYIQKAVTVEGGVGVETIFYHESGQSISTGVVFVPVDKFNAHGTGSAYTYAKRYSLALACGISADEDDDGNTAVANAPTRSTKVTSAVLEGETVNWEQASEYKASVERALFDEDWGGLKELLDELNEDHVMKTAVWDKLESRDRTKITKWIKDQRETA